MNPSSPGIVNSKRTDLTLQTYGSARDRGYHLNPMSMLPVVPEIRGVVSSILEQASGDLMRLAGRLMFVLSGRNSEFMLRRSAASISTAREGG